MFVLVENINILVLNHNIFSEVKIRKQLYMLALLNKTMDKKLWHNVFAFYDVVYGYLLSDVVCFAVLMFT